MTTLSVTDVIQMIGQLPIAAKHQIRDFLDEELESEEDSLKSLKETQQVYKNIQVTIELSMVFGHKIWTILL